jgi:hypothetical protein
MRSLLLAALTVAASASGPARASEADYVFEPTVEYGEREVDFKYGAASTDGAPSTDAASLGFGYAVKSSWFTEFYAKYKHEDGRTFFDALEWENKFQLTETGRHAVDVGWIVELERPKCGISSDGDQLISWIGTT